MNNNPSIDPANEGSLVGTLRTVFGKLLQDVNGMLPARVIAYDRVTNRAQVQPMIAVLTTDGSQVPRAQIASLPVLQIGGGGHILDFNLVNGDLGWILASDRDISLFLQGYSQAKPNTERKCNFADSLFIPDVMKDIVIDAEDSANAVFQSKDSTVRVALWPEFVKLTAPRGLGINAQPHESSIFDMDSTTKSSSPWPKMTLGQRNAIPSPQEGDAVWVIGAGLSTYNGSVWS
jgi:hypothetical protein